MKKMPFIFFFPFSPQNNFLPSRRYIFLPSIKFFFLFFYRQVFLLPSHHVSYFCRLLNSLISLTIMEEEKIDSFSTFTIQPHTSNMNDSLQLSPDLRREIGKVNMIISWKESNERKGNGSKYREEDMLMGHKEITGLGELRVKEARPSWNASTIRGVSSPTGGNE
jgi:hypothetical protein